MDTRWHQMETSGTACTSLSVRVYSNEGKVRTPPLVLYLRGGSFLAEGARSVRSYQSRKRLPKVERWSLRRITAPAPAMSFRL
ncbi:hypothetical protein QE408_000179 [Agrobacterium larrymoorei]|uniref:Alpha/beta hydrolase n=1 Tax=Agrobacterium larrymoorei TaxID=160699 RepID=A0ABU0UDP7_9HYPH|nr:hypothetical protein [Agrobacterium larrymoorei]